MKKLLLTVLATLLVTATVTYAYITGQMKTNEVVLQIGNSDVSGVTLTPTYAEGARLIPLGYTATQDNEVKVMTFTLHIESDTTRTYTLDTELPPEFKLTTDRTGYVYYTGTTYNLTLELLSEVTYTTYTFYLWVNMS